MIAAQQYIRDFHPSKFRRPGVLRIFDPSRLAKRVFFCAILVPKRSRNNPHHRFNDHHCRHFAAVADEVADRNFSGLKPNSHPLVKPLVPAAKQQNPMVLPKLFDKLLSQPLALRGKRYQQSRLRLPLHMLDTVKDRSGHDDHSRPPAVGAVVDFMVLWILGPIPEVPAMNLNQFSLNREL